ncbi:class I glutamine amidotransferase-like protein [Mollisia scopiformis]|uniref:Class I glutamine amidotransferase-like protein n=1 Tax=Mollisia scopiformis TaxID=149040 RepID=A0A194XAW0_MOLSC|nr:class I glutamine amidotransferase-like protein [Mollisia scopiformis]KUJ16897.1 class I glutamine amidotransferase-like protein [Mollisia scopiformis]
MAPLSLHIVVLDCDTPVLNVYAARGTYGDIFEALLRDAAFHTQGVPELDLEFSSFDCVRGNLPTVENLDGVDGIIITGSAASAYDNAPWIHSLIEFTKELYNNRPHIRLFGSCFGHQLIAHALFSTPSNPVVARDPKGWELGVQPISLSDPILSHFGPVLSNPSSPTQLRMQFVHADHVVLHPIPEGFAALGSSEHCALQGIWRQGRVLTFQGHAEFDRFVNGETFKVFSKAAGWEEKYLVEQLKGVEKDDDAIWAAGMMLRFFLESERMADEEVGRGSEGIEEDSEVMARL